MKQTDTDTLETKELPVGEMMKDELISILNQKEKEVKRLETLIEQGDDKLRKSNENVVNMQNAMNELGSKAQHAVGAVVNEKEEMINAVEMILMGAMKLANPTNFFKEEEKEEEQ